MNENQIGGTITSQLPPIIPPQFSITNKIGPSKLPKMISPLLLKAEEDSFREWAEWVL